jgi:PKD repeat protein
MENFQKAYKWTNGCEQSVTIFMATLKSTKKNQLQMHSNFSVEEIKTFITRIVIIALVLTIDSISGISQKEDHFWMFGGDPFDIILPERASDTTRGATNMDFNYDPVRIYYDPKRFLDMEGGNSSICNNEGLLIAYSNGQVIIDKDNTSIADTINYDYNIPRNCNEWEINNLGNNQIAIPTGLSGWQRVIFMPINNKIFCIYNFRDYCKGSGRKMLYSTVEYENINQTSLLKEKDRMIISDSTSSPLYAIRHGNGIDWWLVTLNLEFTELLVFLVDSQGVLLKNKQKVREPNSFKSGIGQIVASPDGKYLAWYNGFVSGATGGGFTVADFDRCDGTVSNIKTKVLNQPSLSSGTAFSSDSRYLYVCNGDLMYQYDMTNSNVLQTEKIVAQYDGYKHYFEFDTIQPNPIGYSVNFCLMKLGPDGRIYIFPSTALNRWISVIQNPTEGGVACDVRQHSILMSTNFTRTVPNMPEFRLGPLDGSPCDTLGIDNHPIAKYRYEPDTIDHLRIRFTDLSYFRPETWSWDFGDGSPQVSMRHPYHSYAAAGTYNVCLTVSNENSSNTSCRIVTIGTSSVDDGISVAVADITLFPNPVEDYLLVTLGEYIPQYGQIMIFDISGRSVHTQRIYYGQNNVDMAQLVKGMYVWKMMDGQVEIESGKVVKM